MKRIWKRKWFWPLVVILVAVVIVRLIAVTASWQPYAGDYREFTSLAEKIPRGR